MPSDYQNIPVHVIVLSRVSGLLPIGKAYVIVLIVTEFLHLMSNYAALNNAFGCFAIPIIHSLCLDGIRDDTSESFSNDKKLIGQNADSDFSLIASTGRPAAA